jgi:hypothetical protein
MSSQDIHLMLKTKMNALSNVGGINVFDADGTLINSSAIWPTPSVSVADRGYFKTFKSDPHSPAMVVEPVFSRITGLWTTVIARKVTGPNGEFLGVIGAASSPSISNGFRIHRAGYGGGDCHASPRRHAARPLSPHGRHDQKNFPDRSGKPAAGVRAAANHVPSDQPDRRQCPHYLLARADQFPIVIVAPPPWTRRWPVGASRSAS